MPIDIEALLQPISDSHPCGADLRNHPIFIQIREARRQEENLAQGVWEHDVKEADYPLALKLSNEALTKRGKDLQVAAWTTEALLRLEGRAAGDEKVIVLVGVERGQRARAGRGQGRCHLGVVAVGGRISGTRYAAGP